MIFLIPVLFSYLAMACPEISGEYICQAMHGSYPLKVEQIENGYELTIESRKEIYLTNGESYPLPDVDQTMRKRSIKSFCEDDKFLIETQASVFDEGEELGQFITLSSYQMKGNKLKMVLKLNFQGKDIGSLIDVCTIKK
ncbi:MAG: hypothetical protein AB7I27_11650 [Bacteriovoracaceae bacterium]